MARVFTTGFEEGSIATTLYWSVVQTNVTVQTSPTVTPHSGTYAARASGTSQKQLHYALVAAVTSGTYFTRFYWNTATTGVVDSRIFRCMSSGSVSGVEITKLSGAVIRLGNVPSAETTDGIVTLSADTWYRFELKHIISDTVGDVTLNIYLGDSTSALETLTIGAANKDTLPTNIQTWVFEESAVNAALTYRWDDIAINTSVGAVHNSYPGPGKIYLLAPNSDVAITWEDDAGGADNATFANIDEIPGTLDDTDYNASDTLLDVADALGDTDRFGLTDLGAEVTSDAVIALMDVYARVGSNQTSTAAINLLLWDDGGALQTGPSCNCGLNGFRTVRSTEHYAFDVSGAETKATIASFNVGYKTITDVIALRPRRVVALWVNVEWLEGAGVTIAQTAPVFQFPGAMIGRRYV